MNTKRALLAAGAVATCALLLAYVLPEVRRVAASDERIVGSWRIQVIPSSPAGIPPMTNFVAMTQDGRLVNSTHTGLASIGGWRRLGDNKYAADFAGMEIGQQPQRYRIRSTLELKGGDEFSGPFHTEYFDLQGNLVFSIDGTVQGTRLQVEPLP